VTPHTIQRLDQRFASAPVLLGGPVPVGEIEAAEQRIGMPFDADYREFIERYGGAVVGSLPVLGLRQAEVMADDTFSVVHVTERFRAARWSPTELWLVISVDLAGNPIGLSSDGAVWTSDHDAGDVGMVARTFEDFVVQLLDEQ
jgi:hypothetical protein